MVRRPFTIDEGVSRNVDPSLTLINESNTSTRNDLESMFELTRKNRDAICIVDKDNLLRAAMREVPLVIRQAIEVGHYEATWEGYWCPNLDLNEVRATLTRSFRSKLRTLYRDDPEIEITHDSGEVRVRVSWNGESIHE